MYAHEYIVQFQAHARMKHGEVPSFGHVTQKRKPSPEQINAPKAMLSVPTRSPNCRHVARIAVLHQLRGRRGYPKRGYPMVGQKGSRGGRALAKREASKVPHPNALWIQ
jgi:hypothetical protein